MFVRRIQKEVELMSKDPPENCSAGPRDERNLFIWDATIIGPTETPYEGGIFKLVIQFPPEYPHSPPIIKFTTKIFHPNISPSGKICLDILHDGGKAWIPSMTINKVLLSITLLLTTPNTQDPFNIDAAHLYDTNIEEYNATVKEYIMASEFYDVTQ